MTTARAALLLLLLSSACAARPEPSPALREQPVIYGQDGRVELEDVTDDALRAISSMAVAAIVPRARLRFLGGEVELVADSLAQAHGVCADERFADQPSAAVCSGILLGERTLLTAGHCMRRLRCDEIAIVFGYQLNQGAAPTRFAASDVFACDDTLARELSLPGATERADFAWVRLDRAAPEHLATPALRASDAPLSAGEPVAVAGFGSGLPLKVVLGGAVLDARPETRDYFVSDTDTFHGDSGAPVFDAQGRLLGIHVRGNDDYVPSARGCSVAARLGAVEGAAGEENTYLSRALSGLCAAHPGEEVCCMDAGCVRARAQCSSLAGAPATKHGHPFGLALGCAALAAKRRRKRKPMRVVNSLRPPARRHLRSAGRARSRARTLRKRRRSCPRRTQRIGKAGPIP